jgi:tetratricopeptide (TPR) repeat protein
MPATETYPHVRDAVAKALELDPDLAEAHASHAYLRQFYQWDWPGAEAEFRRALTLNPNYATGHQWYAEYLSARGRHAEAIDRIRMAVTLDPVSLIVNAVEANLLYMAGRYDDAIVKSRQVLEMDANFPEAYEYLKRAYDQKGMYSDAVEARQARRRILGRDVRETPALRAAAAATNARVYWRNRLTQEIAESRAEGLLPFEFAEILAQAGDTADALDWLEKACAEHDFMMAYVHVAPNLQPLRAHPRYQNVVRRGCGL